MTDKKPLFKTQDGRDVFSGDEFHMVTSNYSYLGNELADEHDGKIIGLTYFSTREVAELYIAHNKPCLSFKDVADCCLLDAKEEIALKQLIKSKLNT